MDLVRIYECLCDVTRLRILNVLLRGPLCVCHFQSVLREPQVKISKHLAYLKRNGMVEAERRGNWMVYRLPENPSHERSANLACLQDCARENPVFQRDRKRLARHAPALPSACVCGCAHNGSRKWTSAVTAHRPPAESSHAMTM
jgi:ArsR family transcriptional regulator, arsenate/arsenite/antimonite-responsive transcriptional repressor